MVMPKVCIKGNGTVDVEEGASYLDALRKAGYGELDQVLAVKVDGELRDLTAPVNGDCEVEPVTFRDSEGREVYWHSTAHIMAAAVKELFPTAKVTIGPPVETGFYYDFDYERPFTPEDLEKIEAKMAEIIARDEPFRREEVSKDEAIRLFKEMGENYKVEIIEEIPDDKVSLYHTGETFVDLCRGPHIPSSGKVKAVKLLSVAGAYWRGDERNPMLQRIYGVSYPSQEDLEDYLCFLEEARRRDHRRLGKELDLFSIREEVGPGFIIYHPKGALVRTILEDFEKQEHLKRGYQIVMGPTLLKAELWKKSGHWDHYREMMYFTEVDEELYGIKPMNCLAHILIYKSRIRSYRDLPLRYFELGTVHRHEKSGVLHGLLRARAFTQDDAHIFCTPGQLKDEIKGVLNFIHDVMEMFGFPYEVEISTRPEKSIGSDEMWERATSALKESLEELGLPYEICEGEGAFYGPKIDVKLTDAIGRKWQCGTVQCDFALPERFDLTYVDSDGEKKRPAMVHRVILGSIDRFLGVLIEHYAGAFPLWLAPVQARVMNITDDQAEYARQVADRLTQEGFRVEADLRNEKLGAKVRDAQMEKIPYMLIVGKREMAGGRVAVRHRRQGDLGPMELEEIIQRMRHEVEVKASE
ncbi:MAG: threonine--tRNA ligase [Aquificota bacterium]|nr:MAG: threonine--tRNA ligase [Aquificota bacterium]